MSTFSTISTQHSALRELEHKRLERMMGQLRKDVESKSGRSTPSATTAPRNGERRFQPPRRRDSKGGFSSKPAVTSAITSAGDAVAGPHPPANSLKTAARSPTPRRSGATPCATRSATPVGAATSAGEARDARRDAAAGVGARVDSTAPGAPGAEASASTAERAQSVEIAWLWAVKSRMDEDALEVSAFLTRNGLDRYASLFAEDSTGIGASLDSLREADDAALAELGLPASPRARLRQALCDEENAQVAADVQAALQEKQQQQQQSPSVARPLSSVSFGTDAASMPSPAGGTWGVLGRVPPGWHRTGSTCETSVRTRKTPVILVDAAIGSGDELPADESADSMPAVCIEPAWPSSRSHFADTPVGADASRFAGAVAMGANPSPAPVCSRPATANSSAQASRPSSSHGAPGDKVCCYECYKKVYSKFAVTVEDEGQARRFCGDDCVENFRKALFARNKRMRELTELRHSLLEQGVDTELRA